MAQLIEIPQPVDVDEEARKNRISKEIAALGITEREYRRIFDTDDPEERNQRFIYYLKRRQKKLEENSRNPTRIFRSGR
jgi:hypothetical protein